MFCSKCGKDIDDSAVVCVHCGVGTQNLSTASQQNPANQPIIINNSSSSSAAAAASAAATPGFLRRRHSLAFDIFMICITGGLWAIWMILRPKYY